MDDLLSDFLTETSESLATLDTALVKLEQSPDDGPTLSLIFRLVHTIKGTCGFLGLPRLEKVAHAGENVLGKIRDGALRATPDAISLVLAAIDRIKLIVSGLEATEAEPEGNDTALIAALDAMMEGKAPPEAAATPAPAPVAMPVTSPAVPQAAAQPAAAAPPAPPAPPAPVVEPAIEAAAPEVEAAREGGAVANQTIRVNVDVLEDLMTLVSELVLARNQLMQLARSQENGALTVPLQRLSHITSDLQEGVMKTRMQPIGNAWNKLPRLVRDLARETGKKIDLIMLGAETELDRQVLELIKDPLTHMVRNSADHGLEGPEARRQAGKPELGRIQLNAFHEGGHIIIEIADDGRGLATARIKQKAVQNGLATEAELAVMSESEVQQFIFRAGFSTAAAITAVSGRGVGMDVVKTNIEKIGGTIELRSTEGKGTVFTIKIPLTLAIVSALIVECAGERFAIPQISVVELVKAGNENDTGIEHISSTPVLRLRDRLLPLVDLRTLLALNDATDKLEGTEAFIVVVRVGASIFGLIVDRVFDTEEIVVKPVAPILRHLTLFSGNTILGDGSVIMILDPNGIARTTSVSATGRGDGMQAAVRPAELTAGQEKTSLLLFRAGGPEPKAVPLALVARLEDIANSSIEWSNGAPVTQYRGALMPLVVMGDVFAGMGTDRERFTSETGRQSVLVFIDRGRAMGLVVDEILDVVDDRMDIALGSGRQGVLGSAVISGKATEVVDASYWLGQAFSDWFMQQNGERARKPRILIVEDSGFFRNILVPVLNAAGYAVTAAADPTEALRLAEAKISFDVIISDIEMPEMDGFEFAAAVRRSGPWSNLPMIALSSRVAPGDMERGREAGFTDYVAKFDRDALLRAVSQCLATKVLEGV